MGFPQASAGVGCVLLLQAIFPTRGSNHASALAGVAKLVILLSYGQFLKDVRGQVIIQGHEILNVGEGYIPGHHRVTQRQQGFTHYDIETFSV